MSANVLLELSMFPVIMSLHPGSHCVSGQYDKVALYLPATEACQLKMCQRFRFEGTCAYVGEGWGSERGGRQGGRSSYPMGVPPANLFSALIWPLVTT